MTALTLNQADYALVHADIVALLESAHRTAARSVNALMTASYWQIGRRIVEFEQGGENRAAYGQALLPKLSADLTRQFGRGFGADHLELMRLFYQTLSSGHDFRITGSEISPSRPVFNFRSGASEIRHLPAAQIFPLSK